MKLTEEESLAFLNEAAERMIEAYLNRDHECIVMIRNPEGHCTFIGRPTLTADQMMKHGRESIKKHYAPFDGNETVN